MREMPNPAQTEPGGRLSLINAIARGSASTPQGIPMQSWNRGGPVMSPSEMSCFACQIWPRSKTSISGLVPQSRMRSAITRR